MAIRARATVLAFAQPSATEKTCNHAHPDIFGAKTDGAKTTGLPSSETEKGEKDQNPGRFAVAGSHSDD